MAETPGTIVKGRSRSMHFRIKRAPGSDKPGHAGVGDQRHGLAGRQSLDQLGSSHRLVMLVIADQWFPDFEVSEQVPRMPRVLGGDQIDRLENGKCAQRDVVEISDRRADDVKHGRLSAGNRPRANPWTTRRRASADLESKRPIHRVIAQWVWANTCNKFDPTCPFGGYRESGFGREGGLHGLPPYLNLV